MKPPVSKREDLLSAGEKLEWGRVGFSVIAEATPAPYSPPPLTLDTIWSSLATLASTLTGLVRTHL